MSSNNYGMYFGAPTPESIQAMREAVMGIIQAPHTDEKTKQLALKMFGKGVASPSNNTISGCHVQMSPAPVHIGDGNEMAGWISVKNRQPEPFEGNRVLGHNGQYAFECEFEDGVWCNIGGESMTHWMPLPEPPQQEEAER